MSVKAALAIIKQHQDTIARLEALAPAIADFAQRLGDCLERGGTVLWLGNGGSAGDAQHLSAELVGRYQRERPGLRSLALSTDTSLMTAVANDYGYHRVFARQVETLARPGDVVVAISTSGNSRNVVEAAQSARGLKAVVVAMTGEGGGKLASCCDLLLAMPSTITARIQEAHSLIGHLACELLDERFAPGAPAAHAPSVSARQVP